MEDGGKKKGEKVGGGGARKDVVVEGHDVEGEIVELELVKDIREDQIEQKQVDDRDKVAIFAGRRQRVPEDKRDIAQDKEKDGPKKDSDIDVVALRGELEELGGRPEG